MEIIKKKAIKLVPKEYDEIYYQTRDNEIFLVKDEALAHELELDERDSFLDSISFVENKKLSNLFSHTNKIFKFTNNVDFSLLCSYLSIDGISFNELNERINPITDLTKDEEYVCICGDIQVNGSDGSNEMLNYMKFIPYITYKEIILF